MNKHTTPNNYSLIAVSCASAYLKQKFSLAHRVSPIIVYPKTVPSASAPAGSCSLA